MVHVLQHDGDMADDDRAEHLQMGVLEARGAGDEGMQLAYERLGEGGDGKRGELGPDEAR